MENTEPKLLANEKGCGKFVVADEFIDQYAAVCGWKGLAVYIALCRYANKERQCFPSIAQLAKKLGIAANSVKRGLGELRQWNIIKVEKSKRTNGTWKNNVYSLLDRSKWQIIPTSPESFERDQRPPIPQPQLSQSLGYSPTMTKPELSQGLNHSSGVTKPQPPQRPDHSPGVPTKDSHLEGDTYKGTHKEGLERRDLEQRVIPYQQEGVHNSSTPAGMMRNFIVAFKAQNAQYANLLQQLNTKGIPTAIATSELVKFYNYWTELNPTGTKQRWELEPTFEVSKRLAIWFSNYGRFRPKEREKKGIAIT